MNNYAYYTLCFFVIAINLIVLLYGYAKCSNFKFKIGLKELAIIIVSSLINIYVNFSFSLQYRVTIVYLVLFVLIFKLVFNENLINLIIKLIVFNILVTICDFAISIGVVALHLTDYSITKLVSTLLISILEFGIFRIRPFTDFVKRLFNYLIKRKNILLLISSFMIFIVFCILSYFHIVKANYQSYILTLIVLIVFIFLWIVALYQYFKNKQSKMEQQSLLNVMVEYEKMLDNDRINRHEMLNNLVVIKSYKNKSSKKYEEMIDNIISNYQNKKANTYSSLTKLPSGIKGIVYYKIANIADKDIVFNTLISKESYKQIEHLDTKLYYNICKALGILLDNAIEAASSSNEKEILLDIYNEEDRTCIYIENTFSGNIDINQINKKGYSSKGKNRGLGLHIINRLLKNDDALSLTQYIHKDKFISILTIKNPSKN